MERRSYVITNGQIFLTFGFKATKYFGEAGKWDQEIANNILEDLNNSCKYMRYNLEVKQYTYMII